MRPLSAALPLRTTVVWGAFRDALPIPQRYGDTAGELIQFDPTRTRFAWADHAVAAIDGVDVSGQAVTNWTWSNAVDASGHAVALVVFDQPQDEGATIVARGRGKLHPVDGRPLVNPADVIWDILANIAGRPVSEAALDAFRRACDAAELVVGGSITRADSVQSVVRQVCESIGAVFCPDMPGLCRLWPGPLPAAARLRVEDGAFGASASSDAIVNDLTVQFAYEGDAPREALQLEAPDSVAEFERQATTLNAPWISSARVAAAVAYRILAHRARPQWEIRVSPAKRVDVGDVLTLAHPYLPVSGSYLVLERELDVDAGNVVVSLRVPAGDAPAIRLVRQSAAFEPEQYAGIAVATQGSDRVLTLREEDGSPIVGAAVTLDGVLTRTSDSTGRVSFPVASMPPGNHVLLIVTLDGRRLTTEVLVQ